MAAARAWYTDFFGAEPYYVRDGYLDWRFGRDVDEFGIMDATYIPGRLEPTPGGQYVYWSVDDVQATFNDMLARGATLFEASSRTRTGAAMSSPRAPQRETAENPNRGGVGRGFLPSRRAGSG